MTDFKYFVDTSPYIYCLEGEKASDLTKRAKTFFKKRVFQWGHVRHIKHHF